VNTLRLSIEDEGTQWKITYIVHDIDSKTNIYIDANIAIYNNLCIKIYDINTCHNYNTWAAAKLPT